MLKRTAKPENAQPAAKRKLTRAERKQIEAIIRQAKGNGKPHTVQDSIPFRNLYPDGLCRLDDRLFSKTISKSNGASPPRRWRCSCPSSRRSFSWAATPCITGSTPCPAT
mgnify:CR=1 FL=1